MDKKIDTLEPTISSAKTPTLAHTQQATSTPSVKIKKRWLATFFTILLLVLIGAGSWWFYAYKNPSANPFARKAPTSKLLPIVSGYVFYDSPKQLGDLKFFKADFAASFGQICTSANQCGPMIKTADINYYQIGTTPSRQPIIVVADYNAGLISFYYTALQVGTDQYTILGKLASRLDPSVAADKDDIASFKSTLNSNTTLDTATSIPPLTFPSSFTINGQPLLLSSSASEPTGYFIQGLATIRGPYYGPKTSATTTKIVEDGQTTFYEATIQDQPNYQIKKMYGAVGGVYAAPYSFVSPVSGDAPADIIWDNSGTPNINAYADATEGCGALGGYIITKNVDKSQLVRVGVGSHDQIIYSLPTDSALFKAYFANYNGGADLDKDSVKNWTAQQFQSNYALLVAINPLGEQVVYERKDVMFQGGCGKPVVYLYPTQPTDVSVAVGAHIQQSEPLYGPLGWQHVLAQPNGSLDYQGHAYPSLYWEGTGVGTYPIIDFGTVVKRDDAVATIRNQLAQQGFTASETNDFLAYWQPKLPTTPYVRLSWLTTKQMDELAPLQITPHPTTVIRAFLDFQGLNSPVPLAPQTFQAPRRNGFTVVEWGGLLRPHL